MAVLMFYYHSTVLSAREGGSSATAIFSLHDCFNYLIFR